MTSPEMKDPITAPRVERIARWIENGMPDQSDDTPTHETLKRDLTALVRYARHGLQFPAENADTKVVPENQAWVAGEAAFRAVRRLDLLNGHLSSSFRDYDPVDAGREVLRALSSMDDRK